MAKYHFNALDKDSSASYTETHDANNLGELQEAWNEFKGNVPFSRWYHDNTTDEPEDEANLEELE